jgi:hypothetical protein
MSGMFRERWRSLLNVMVIHRATVGRNITAGEMARALRIKGTIHALKRNGKNNDNGQALRLLTAQNALRKDLI